jgi:hypothetical protein
VERSLWILALVLLAAAVSLSALGFFLPLGYLQGLSGNVASTLLGLAAAILLVNYYLASSEKGKAAAPLVKLIAPAIKELHNDLFVIHLRNTFGIEKMRILIDTYQKNNRNPRAFSPEQCNELHAAIMSKRTELLRVYDLLIDQFRELSMIIGWSFDPSVTAAALEARLNFMKFKSLQQAQDQDSKYEIVEAYLDGEAAASAVFEKLLKRLGLPEKEWKGKDI